MACKRAATSFLGSVLVFPHRLTPRSVASSTGPCAIHSRALHTRCAATRNPKLQTIGTTQLHSTAQTNSESEAISLQYAVGVEAPLFYRRSLEALVPLHDFRIAGVSFEQERQDAVRGLHQRQTLMLQPEPWNVYDDKAVAIKTFSGATLGYVPRDINEQFQVQEVVFAHVTHVGANDKGIWGALLTARPQLMAASIQALPVTHAHLLTEAGLRQALGQERWAQLQGEAAARSLGRCEVTGAGPEEAQLQYIGVWRYNHPAKQVQLMRLAHVSADVALLSSLLQLDDVAEKLDSLVLLSDINGLAGMEEAEQYLEAMKQQVQELDREGWQVVL